MSDLLATVVAGHLRAFLSSTEPDPLALRAVVAKFGALPLIIDMGGCYALRGDGEVVSFAWDEPHGLGIETDERLRNVALYHGSLRYPDLAALVPHRAPDSIDCPSCGGRGTVSLAGRKVPNVICFCGGLGWVPRSSAPMPRTP